MIIFWILSPQQEQEEQLLADIDLVQQVKKEARDKEREKKVIKTVGRSENKRLLETIFHFFPFPEASQSVKSPPSSAWLQQAPLF